ncbi:MAG: hypothetical protein JRG67_16975 [Deltaproteobacteria bacterium]|nr:hypothetical protein [Deltaproteobacteria bacterium]
MIALHRHRLGVLAAAVSLCMACTESSSRVGGEYKAPSPPDAAPLAGTVDPFIGTAADGMTFPGALVPWGMASPSPHTKLTTAADGLEGVFVNGGYRHGDPQIHGFGLTRRHRVRRRRASRPTVRRIAASSPTRGTMVWSSPIWTRWPR